MLSQETRMPGGHRGPSDVPLDSEDPADYDLQDEHVRTALAQWGPTPQLQTMAREADRVVLADERRVAGFGRMMSANARDANGVHPARKKVGKHTSFPRSWPRKRGARP